jgi:microcystin-dependent protein
MKSLENQFISDTYPSLLHTLNDSGVPTTGLDDIYDGGGNQTALSLGAKGKGAVVTGSFIAGNVTYPTSTDPKSLIDVLFPIGSVYFTATNSSPSTFMGGTWGQIAQGRFITGVGTGSDPTGITKDFNAGNNNGTYQVSLDKNNIPAHSHYIASSDIVPATTANALTESKSLAVGAAVALDQAYLLKGGPTAPTLGRTSIVGNTADTSGLGTPISTTPPSFGLYIWQRTA